MARLHYYLGPWVWVLPVFDDDGNEIELGYWRAPTGTVGLIDLRGIPDQSLSGVLGARPYGFFAVDGTLGTDYDLLGTGDLREIRATAAMKSAWFSLLGYTPQGDTLNDLLFDHMTNGSDPTFQDDRVPTLMPTTKGILEIHLGSHSLIKSERFRFGTHSHTNKVQAVLHRNYRQMQADIDTGRMAENHIRRVLDYWLDKYRIRKTIRTDWEQFVPPELRDGHEGPLPHRTIITESFNQGDSTTLGPDQTWAETSGDWETVSNEVRTSIIGGQQTARCEVDLSGDDHYGELVIATWTGTNKKQLGPTCRRSVSVETYYHAAVIRGTTNTGPFLLKTVTGTLSVLDSDTSGISPPETHRVESNGSTIRHLIDGVEKFSVTDTAITSNLRCGLYGRTDVTVGEATGDSFEAADLAIGIQVLRRRREGN